jgi:tetrahydromethanopterin S-methyltransferase subunit B
MKNIIQAIFLVVFLTTFTTQAQQLSIDDQFKDLINKSNNYKGYKVVKKEKFYKLRKNVSDSIAVLEGNIITKASEIEIQNSEINSLTVELATTKKELISSKGKENGIYVLGVLTNKSTYTFMVFITLGILSLIIVVLFIKYKSGFDIIKTTKIKLLETDDELEKYRQRSLDREQQLRRKLQDEINKKNPKYH